MRRRSVVCARLELSGQQHLPCTAPVIKPNRLSFPSCGKRLDPDRVDVRTLKQGLIYLLFRLRILFGKAFVFEFCDTQTFGSSETFFMPRAVLWIFFLAARYSWVLDILGFGRQEVKMADDMQRVKTSAETRTVEIEPVIEKSVDDGRAAPLMSEKASIERTKTPPPEKPLFWKVVRFMQDQWFLIALVILIAIASQHQVPSEQQKLKTTVVSYLCVSVIFFITGCTIKTQVLVDNYKRWKVHLFVQLQCFFVFSLIMFGIVSAAAKNRHFMDPGLLCGMILTGCVATTISSNVVMTGQAHGTQALTVVESTVGNFLGPFLTPLLFKAYLSNGAWYTKVLPNEPGGYAALYQRVFKQLGLSVFVPMVSSLLVAASPLLTRTGRWTDCSEPFSRTHENGVHKVQGR